VSGYRKEWPCCGDETYTEAWEPERCPFCELNDAQDRIAELETELEAVPAPASGEVEPVGEVDCTENTTCFGDNNYSYQIKMYKCLPEEAKLYTHPPTSRQVPENQINFRIYQEFSDLAACIGAGATIKDVAEHVEGVLKTTEDTTPPESAVPDGLIDALPERKQYSDTEISPVKDMWINGWNSYRIEAVEILSKLLTTPPSAVPEGQDND